MQDVENASFTKIIASVNKVIDRDAIKNIVSTEINHSYKALENKLKKKDDEIDDLKRKNAEIEKNVSNSNSILAKVLSNWKVLMSHMRRIRLTLSSKSVSTCSSTLQWP